MPAEHSGQPTGAGTARRWLLLAGAVGCEVAGSLSLRAGVDQPGWYAAVAVGYLGAFALLAAVLREGMALSVAYGIWGATGVVLTAVLGAALFGEPLTAVMGLGVGLIVAGVLLVELGSKRPVAHVKER
ncbi:MAG TPA: multidrug efflux SMR transporter [Actinomycetaceae bacterium]|nr:multidrug efflux SMR transporter [Actinomycetaceae bacterium]